MPIGGALFAADGTLLGRGHNRRVQNGDPSVHGETDAFRNAGRQRTYRARRWSRRCHRAGTAAASSASSGSAASSSAKRATFVGGHDWLAEHGVEVVLLDDQRCVDLLGDFIDRHPEIWNEDIGE